MAGVVRPAASVTLDELVSIPPACQLFRVYSTGFVGIKPSGRRKGCESKGTVKGRDERDSCKSWSPLYAVSRKPDVQIRHCIQPPLATCCRTETYGPSMLCRQGVPRLRSTARSNVAVTHRLCLATNYVLRGTSYIPVSTSHTHRIYHCDGRALPVSRNAHQPTAGTRGIHSLSTTGEDSLRRLQDAISLRPKRFTQAYAPRTPEGACATSELPRPTGAPS